MVAFSKNIATLASVAFLLASPATAFWRLPCRGVLSTERVDPIDAPDKVAAHVHQVHGGNNFGFKASNDDLRKSTCTSCAVKGDLSAYWYPTLYWQDFETGKLEAIKSSGGALIYYLLRPEDGVSVKPFPEDFRVIAGDGTLRTWPWESQETNDPRVGKEGTNRHWSEEDKLNEQKKRAHAIGWNCLNQFGPVEDTAGRKFLPQGKSCDFGLRAEMYFPSCWDGINPDSADHRSHMAYPSLVEAGECPPGFPVRLPTLLFEVIWETPKYVARGNGQLVLSNGDATGYGWHADFMNGWDQALLEKAVNTCLDINGDINTCAAFGTLQTVKEQEACAKTARYDIDEEAHGPEFSELPGCNKITGGPDRGIKGGCPDDLSKITRNGHGSGAANKYTGGSASSNSGSSSSSGTGSSSSGSSSGSRSSAGSSSGSSSSSSKAASSNNEEYKAADVAAAAPAIKPAAAAVAAPAANEAAPVADATVAGGEPDAVVVVVTETVYVTAAAKRKRHIHGVHN